MSNLFQQKMNVLAEAFKQELEFEENNAAFMVDDIVYDFSFEEDNGHMLVYSVLAPLDRNPPEVNQAIFKRLLNAQYCFCESGNFTFGVDADVTMVNLQVLLDLNTMDDLTFTDTMEKFVQHSSIWSKIIQQMIDEPGTGHENETSGFGNDNADSSDDEEAPQVLDDFSSPFNIRI